MEILIFIIIVIAILYFISKKPTTTPAPTNESAADSPPDHQAAVDALTRVTNACQKFGGDGFSSLIVAASADGKVSRDELRIIMWFCEAVGAQFSDEDTTYISKLNAGVNLSVNSSAGGAAKIAADCADLDIATLARLYAAHTAIGKPWNKTAKRSRETLGVIEGLIASKVGAN